MVSHLFHNPIGKSTISVTSKALLLNFIGGWFILIFLTVVSDENPLELVASISVSKYFSLVTTLILLAVAVPIIEELLFRGLILDSLSESYGSWASIFISSVNGFSLAFMPSRIGCPASIQAEYQRSPIVAIESLNLLSTIPFSFK